MKKFKRNNNRNTYEVVVPFGDTPVPADGFYDDCPLCRELREKVNTGEIQEVSFEMPIWDEDHS